MAEPIVVSSLKNLRRRLAGEAAYHSEREAQLRADLVHVDAVLRLLGAEEPEALPAIGYRTRWFKRGAVTRTLLEILRDAEHPMTAREIATRVLELQGLSGADKRAQSRVRQTVLNALGRCHEVTCEVGRNREKRWMLAGMLYERSAAA